MTTKPTLLLALALAATLNAADYPQWGGGNTRHMVSDEKGLPIDFDPGKKYGPKAAPKEAVRLRPNAETANKAPGAEDIDMSTTKNCLWVAKLGSQTYGTPVIANGQVYVGTNNESPRDDYHIAVRHRNHLAVMTDAPVEVSVSVRTYDLTNGSTALYGTEAAKTIGSVSVLWAGNCLNDATLRYIGAGNVRDPILVQIGGSITTATVPGYLPTDVNMDGTVRYVGAANDRYPILVSIGGNVPTNTSTGYKQEDINLDGEVKYTGQNNDRDPILVRIGGVVPTNTVQGYFNEDVNLDGVVKYTGTNNDRDKVLQTIGGVVPTNIRLDHLPN